MYAVNGLAATTYTYDANGLRTSRVVGGAATQFIVQGGNVALEVEGSGVTAKYVWDTQCPGVQRSLRSGAQYLYRTKTVDKTAAV